MNNEQLKLENSERKLTEEGNLLSLSFDLFVAVGTKTDKGKRLNKEFSLSACLSIVE